MDVAAWKTLNRLVGEALVLPATERTAWVDGLAGEYDAFKPRLRAMLEAAESTGYDGFLDTLPKFDGGPLAGDGLDDGPRHEASARIGPYALIREIASGGQGAVWLAERVDGAFHRTVALKLPVGLAYRPGLAARMARERDILVRLEHPHIARLYDAGLSLAGEPYLALEYVDGVAIDAYVRQRGLGVRDILDLARQIMRAVAHAHSLLIIHRDLKPSNILVTSEGEVRLLDFGIASLLDADVAPESTATAIGGRAFTLPYASPEQITRAPLGLGTDVYSLGVVLFELLTDVRPHRPARDSVAALEEAIVGGDIVWPSEAAADPARRAALRGDLDTILLKALRVAPAERYASVPQFADDLERYLDGRPVLARPDSATYRARKFLARHRWGATAAAVTLVALLGGAGVALWQAREAHLAQARAETIAGFITSMFRDIDPNLRGEGRPFTAADVLGLARSRLEGNGHLGPDVRADLLETLGEAYSGIGDPAAALEILTRSVADSTAVYGAEATKTLVARLQRVRALQYVNKGEDALKEVAAIIDVLSHTGRLGTMIHATALDTRVEVLLNNGKAVSDEAEAAGLEALAAAQQLPAGTPAPADDRRPLVASAHRSLAVIFRTRSQHQQAVEHAELGYRLTSDLRHHDESHPQVILARNELGRALFQAGRTADAIAHLQAAADHGQRTFTDNPAARQHLLGTLANVQIAYGDLKHGISNLDAAMSIDLGAVRVSPVYRASQDVVRARALLAARRLSDAVDAYDRALAVYETTPDKELVLTLQTERAEALVRAEREGEVAGVLEGMVAGRPTDPKPSVQRALWLLGEIRRRQHRDADALPLFREALNGVAATGRSKIDRGYMQWSLGLSLLAEGDADGAIAALTEARAALSAGAGTMTPSVADVLIGLARAYLAKHDVVNARPLAEQAARFWREFEPATPEATEAAHLLAPLER